MRVVTLVPRRADGGWRDQLWSFCRDWWAGQHPDWHVFEGDHVDGPFNRSAAINAAAENADEWDVAVLLDADVIVDPTAVGNAVEIAHTMGRLVVPHSERIMLHEPGTRKVLAGSREGWRNPGYVHRGRRDGMLIYTDSVSCAVAVPRSLWDQVGGFDPLFVGWGWEDNSFVAACETFSGPLIRLASELYHLHHDPAPGADPRKRTELTAVNEARFWRYHAARGDRAAMQVLLDERHATIPRILHRTVPEHTSPEVEGWWDDFARLHPGWDLRTHRDPLDPTDWPLTSDLWSRCANGAQLAGLIRLEALVTHGGVYVDSDMRPVRPLDPLLAHRAFAAWEDERVVPDAVLACTPQHPAFVECLRLARESIERGEDAWKSGPDVTTRVLPGRADVALLEPAAFYPVHYREQHLLGTRDDDPRVFAEHQWHGSWLTDAQRAEIGAPPRTHRFEGVAICIPWTPGDEHRNRSHDWTVNYWRTLGLPVFEGVDRTGGRWPNRAAMRNDAARQALDAGADVLVFADADTFAAADQLSTGVAAAREHGVLVMPFRRYHRLTRQASAEILRHTTPPDRTLANLVAASDRRGENVGWSDRHDAGVIIVTADTWRTVGGYDERFTRWGDEDRCFRVACDTLAGPAIRIDGAAIHLWHPPAGDVDRHARSPERQAQIALSTRYRTAAAWRSPVAAEQVPLPDGATPDPDALTAILAEPGGPLARSLTTA